jgi:hypothetical protein
VCPIPNTKTCLNPTKQTQVSGLLLFLKKLKNLWVFRLVPEICEFGIVGPGFNVTWETRPADVLSLIRKLRPQDCGKELIRIGGTGDGGYLVPDDLDGIKYCFSPGVSTKSNFENQLADRGIRSYLADYSVDALSINRPEFTFDKKYLGSTNNERFLTLASWKDKYLADYTGDLILQMDIEGHEYQVILNVPDELLSQFRIIVIEFHHLQRLFDPLVFEVYSSCFMKLLEHFSVVHIHPNNIYGCVKRGNIQIPRFMEFTFLNKKRVSNTSPVRIFPNMLDSPNIPYKSELRLPKCWRGI